MSGDSVVNGNGNSSGSDHSGSGQWTVVDQMRPLDRI